MLQAFPHNQPLALPLAEREGFRRHELGGLLVRRLDKPEEYAPVLYERDGPTRGGLALALALVRERNDDMSNPSPPYGPPECSTTPGAVYLCGAGVNHRGGCSEGQQSIDDRGLAPLRSSMASPYLYWLGRNLDIRLGSCEGITDP